MPLSSDWTSYSIHELSGDGGDPRPSGLQKWALLRKPQSTGAPERGKPGLYQAEHETHGHKALPIDVEQSVSTALASILMDARNASR